MQSYTDRIMQRIIDQVEALDHARLMLLAQYLDRLEARPDRTAAAAETDPAAQKFEK